ncbi:hypothetical protein ILUMI_19895 [Ignelater luminosus]|uniref:Transposable element P transposase n=1 Tax=Ignelater luminosus TaxID=2038154 RepID=A0A8K0G555_IGNLU|nr:hypothetical protein ILUMI_19895 [Ignelater luminosus]
MSFLFLDQPHGALLALICLGVERKYVPVNAEIEVTLDCEQDTEISKIEQNMQVVTPDISKEVIQPSKKKYIIKKLNQVVTGKRMWLFEDSNNDVDQLQPSPSKKRCSFLGQVAVTRQKSLTPRCKKLYKSVIGWSKKTARLQYKLKNYQTRLECANKIAKSEQFQNLMFKVNPTTYNFILQQIRNQKLPSKVRRFTLEEKIFAVTLLKASGKGYRLLSKIFALPSVRTLTNLLSKLPFGTGINKQLFNSLKETVQKLPSKDRNSDRIQGLSDDGVTRKIALADHATVFMIKGLRTQWKQALSFIFSSGPLKSTDLKKQIVGSANQSAIALLVEDTKESFLQLNMENQSFGFIINNKETIPLYDVLHLFKDHMNKMKVSYATQVFSHQVGSLMLRIPLWGIQNEEYTLDNMLFEEKFQYVIPRNLNQDALENFFGCLRSHGVRNTSPDVSHFINSFKILIINNYMAVHSPGKNCEKDYSCGALDNLRCLLTGEVEPGMKPLEEENRNDNLKVKPYKKVKSRVAKWNVEIYEGIDENHRGKPGYEGRNKISAEQSQKARERQKKAKYHHFRALAGSRQKLRCERQNRKIFRKGATSDNKDNKCNEE